MPADLQHRGDRDDLHPRVALDDHHAALTASVITRDATPAEAEEGLGPLLSDPTRPVRAALRGIASIAAPTSVVTSLLFYFGWVRTSVQAADMGLHDSLLGYSTRDYILNSLDAMVWPLAVAVVTALAALGVHFRMVGWAAGGLNAGRRRRLRLLAGASSAAGAICVLSGAFGSRRTDPSRLVFLASPLLLTGGVVVAAYASYVRRRFVRIRAAPPATELGPLKLVASSLVVVLLILGLFFSVERYAYVKGGDRATEFVRALPWQPDVTVYSARRLHLQAPVVETDLGDDGSAYRFRYSGLKLLFRAAGSYFLRPSDESVPINIVIPTGDGLRFEFSGDDPGIRAR